MLTQLLPDQISHFWDIIKYAIEQSLPPITHEHPDKMNRILSSLISGKAQCWASYNKSEKEIKFEGIVVTRFLYDDVSNTKNLLIYCLYGYQGVNKSSWLHGLRALTKYASANGCKKIIAYTDIPYIINIAQQLNGATSYTFLTFDIDKIDNKINGLEE